MFALNSKQQKLKRKISSNFKFRLYLLFNLPIGWLAGMKIIDLTEKHCITGVPFKWINKNPFKSVYFAVQSMTANYLPPPLYDCHSRSSTSIALIIVGTGKIS